MDEIYELNYAFIYVTEPVFMNENVSITSPSNLRNP